MQVAVLDSWIPVCVCVVVDHTLKNSLCLSVFLALSLWICCYFRCFLFPCLCGNIGVVRSGYFIRGAGRHFAASGPGDDLLGLCGENP